MNDSGMRLTVLGARGSIPVSGPQFALFGGSTSCYMVEAGGETIFLDAGTGLLSAPVNFSRPPVILLSHLHLDHVLGLGMYPRLLQAGAETRLMLPAADAQEARDTLARVFGPPYWPLTLTEYRGNVDIAPLTPHFTVGAVEVDCLEGRHPGGCTVFRLRCGDESLVCATDYEPDDISFAALSDFCAGAGLILYDAQYTAEEYGSRAGFGHSTAEKGLELLEKSGAAQLLLVHHSPDARDEELLRRERALQVHYAREGEVFTL